MDYSDYVPTLTTETDPICETTCFIKNKMLGGAKEIETVK